MKVPASPQERLVHARAQHRRALDALAAADQRARVAQERLEIVKVREARTRQVRRRVEAELAPQPPAAAGDATA